MENTEKHIEHFFIGKEDVVSVHLFGSLVKGIATQYSDVDCAVLFQTNHIPAPMDLIQMREDLSDALKIDVDLICLNTASPIIGMQVYKYGKVVLNNSPKQYARYIIDLFTDYFDLKWLRQPLEENILKRKYYG